MRKLFLAALAVAVAVSGFSVIANAGQGEAGTSWDLTLKPNRVEKPAKIHAVLMPAKVDDQGTADRSDDVYGSTEKNTIIFTRGSSVDTSALPRCKVPASDVGRGEQCPRKTRVGDGSASVVVGGTNVGEGKRQGGTDLNAVIEVFNTKRKLLIVVQACAPGTGPTPDNPDAPCDEAGTPQVIEGNWSKVATRPKLSIPTPQSLTDVGIVIRRVDLFTEKHTKTVNEDGKEVLRSFVFTPETCGGKWKSSLTSEYSDGTSQTIKDSQKCRQPN